MPDQLFIRMAASADRATIATLNDEGQLISRPESVPLATAAARTEGTQVTVLLPAREFVTLTSPLPGSSPARLKRMLPFSLEDEFAADIEELHFAAGSRNARNELAVAVISRDRLDFWLGVLRTAGIEASRIVSEADGIADTPGTTTLLLEGNQVLGRRPESAPFFFDELDLNELWQLLTAERDDDEDLNDVVLFADSETLASRRSEIDSWQPTVVNLNVREIGDGCLPRLASNLVFNPGANLLQGDYAPRSNYAALARPWRLAASFVLGLLALSLVGKGAEVYKLSRDDRLLTGQITELCSRSFSSPQITRCRAEMLDRLRRHNQTAAGGGAGYLATLAMLADISGDALSIENMNFRDGTLRLDVIAPSAGYLDDINQQLAATGQYQLFIESMDSVPGGSGMKTRMRVVEQ